MKLVGLGLVLAALAAAWPVYRLPAADLMLAGMVFCQ